MLVSGEFTWSETNDNIEILIPLKGVSPKKVDVFTASTILKVSFSPFLVDLDLHSEIAADKSKAVLKDGTLKILLAKKDAQLWGQLCFEGTKEEIKQRRETALKKRELEVKHQMEKMAAKKMEEERMIFKQHMELERKERQQMDDVKALEKKNAEDKIFAELQPTEQMTKASRNTAPTNETKDLADPQDCSDEWAAEDSVEDLLPPRATTRIAFKHTPRFFKTPARESTIKTEEEFIIKNRVSLKNNALLSVDKLDDVNPVWLKSKGDEFMSVGDFCSAINAYSDALTLEAGPAMVDILTSRSECYLQLRNSESCIQDCLSVLEQKDAYIFSDAEERVRFERKIRLRLGNAYCLHKQYTLAMTQFEVARELQVNEDLTVEDFIRIRYLKAHMVALGLKEKADRLFSEGNFIDAIGAYTKAVESNPILITPLVNRAACHLAMKDSAKCIKDSTNAMELLSNSRQHMESNALASLLFPDPSTERKWMVTLLCRRSAARRMEKDLLGSLEDLKQAMQYAQRDTDIDSSVIEKDIAGLEQQLKRAKI
jgi:dyslexia susceptibility 1 candidate gene 1 protein